MGLDLNSSRGHHFGVGPYSGIHYLRSSFTYMFAMCCGDPVLAVRLLPWVCEHGEDDGSPEAIRALYVERRRIWEDATDGPVDERGRYLSQLKEPVMHNIFCPGAGVFKREYPQTDTLRGLHHFVKHSDCSGRHNSAEVRRIVAMLDLIQPEIDAFVAAPIAPYEADVLGAWMQGFVDFFRAAAASKASISYS